MAVVALDERLYDLVDADVAVERLATGFVFTEGPLWDRRDNTLLFSDTRTAIMRRWNEHDGSVSVFRDPSNLGNGNTWDKDSNLLTCEQKVTRRIARTLPDGRVENVVDRFGDARLHCPNDIICALNGDILFTDPIFWLRQPDGTIVGQEYPTTGVFRYRLADGELMLLADDFPAPNGLALSDDDSVLYVCDTRERHIRAFGVRQDGSLTNDRVFCEFRHDDIEGRPDGMKLDTQGNVYCAANGPEGVWVFDPQGVLLGFIGVGESPANIAWGGDDWQTLYVCAQTSVYRLRTKAPGQPVRFAPE
ncbi:MAG TPA: SMP-30/gluconolactonase/LRE family protein [Dehalococcoidia bacterium]|nr:SMP-30/gluconolactonase/LRE family protein [Dehalococcoidia bacterium]